MRLPSRRLFATVRIYTWLLAVFAADTAIDAKTFDARKDIREWFRILHVDDSYMLLGGANSLYNVSLEHMTGNLTAVIPTDDRAVHSCVSMFGNYFGHNRESCVNYIRTALKVAEGRFVLCGSNGGTAKCYYYDYDDRKGNWSLSPTPQDYNSPPFAPPFPWMNFTITRTSDNVLYTGGSLIDFSRRLSHVVFRNGSADGLLEPLLSSRATETTVHSLRTYVNDAPQEARIYPNFVASFEAGEHVYWVFSEPALELQPFTYTLSPRVARVCKNDMSNEFVNVGEYTWRLSTFSTYWKARLDCAVPGKHSGFQQYAYDQLGYNAFYFNAIAGATPLGNGSISPRPHGRPAAPIMYGVFNTDRNSIRGSAICAYDHSALAAPFSGPLYLLDSHDPHMASPTESRWTWNIHSFDSFANRDKPHPAQCVSDTRAKSEADVFPRQAMLVDQVKPITSRPLFIQTDHSYLMTHVTVDWQVRALDGRYYDILFVGTDHGMVLKIVNIGGDNDIAFAIIENRTVTEGRAIGEMQMVDRGSHKVMLVNTFDSIRQIRLERCSHYLTCSQCVALRDPYCSWDPTASTCVAFYDGTQSGNYQNIRKGVDNRCRPSTSDLDRESTTARNHGFPGLEGGGHVEDSTTIPSLYGGSEKAVASPDTDATETSRPGAQKALGMEGSTCPFCIYLIPTAVGVVALLVGFAVGWVSRTKCHMVRHRGTHRQDSTIPLTDQCLLKVNNMEKAGHPLSTQSSKVYV